MAQTLKKASIINTVTNERIMVMYNPDELRLDQGNLFAEVTIPGLNTPPIQYISGRARTLAMDLLFDTYEVQPEQDVRLYTNQVVSLLNTLPQTNAPPVLVFIMGGFTFECVLVDVKQRFTMFQPDGTPVRATLSVSFQEYVRVDISIQQGLFIGPPTVHTILSNQTLSGIASDYLGDPSQWRAIAEANNIDDPFHILPGTALRIPRSGGKA
jgi:nucleoid-associated protein YgaU